MTDTYIVKGKNNHFRMMTKALLEFQQKIQEGYVLDETAVGVANRAVFSRSMIRLPMVKAVAEEESAGEPEVPEEPETPDVVEPKVTLPTDVEASAEVDKLSEVEGRILSSEKLKKDELLWYADQKGIEVPADMKVPTQIRKYLKEKIQG